MFTLNLPTIFCLVIVTGFLILNYLRKLTVFTFKSISLNAKSYKYD